MSFASQKVVYRFCENTGTRRKWLEALIFFSIRKLLRTRTHYQKNFEKRFWIFRESPYRKTTPLACASSSPIHAMRVKASALRDNVYDCTSVTFGQLRDHPL